MLIANTTYVAGIKFTRMTGPLVKLFSPRETFWTSSYKIDKVVILRHCFGPNTFSIPINIDSFA